MNTIGEFWFFTIGEERQPLPFVFPGVLPGSLSRKKKPAADTGCRGINLRFENDPVRRIIPGFRFPGQGRDQFSP